MAPARLAAAASAARAALARSGRARPALAALLLIPAVVTGEVVAPPASAAVTPFQVPLPIPAVVTDPHVTLHAQEADVELLPGTTTKMWTYGGTFPGPTIRRPSGQPLDVTLVNGLPAEAGELTLHHHGAHAASEHDGQPHDFLVPTGGSRTYRYEMVEAGEPERGAMQWYHDHRADVTGRNVWMGLAGMVIVDDPAEAHIDAALPNGAHDVPLMLTDRRFDAAAQIPYTFNAEGVLGDVLLVNGAPHPYFEVATRRYRIRVLNASNQRSYDLALSDGRPFVQVGSESGLLPAPVVRERLLLGPAERADLIVDFAGALGQDIVLLNRAATGPMSQVMQFRVRRDEADPSSIPGVLRAPRDHLTGPLTENRTWVLGRDLDSGMWTINGKGFEHDRIDATPVLGTAERWSFVNTTSVDHIVHIHDVDWKVVARSGAPPSLIAPDEAGAKESFRIRPNEAVVVESTFTDHLGTFMWHCHMLEHEDFAMMTHFDVVAPGEHGGHGSHPATASAHH